MISFLKKIFGLNPTPCACCQTDSKEIKHDLSLNEEDKEILKKLDPLIVVGKILEIKPHSDPKITKVQITKCAIGNEEEAQILCGGKNLSQGQIVPVAKVGSTLPGDFKISERDIRGETSNGMICARKELGISLAGEQEKEIWVLPDSLETCLGKSIGELSS